MEPDPKEQDWRHLLAGGFAFMTAPFAVHPLDARRARKMFFAAMRANITFENIKQASADYLAKQSCHPDLIALEVDRVDKFLKSIRPARRKSGAWLVTWEHIAPTESKAAGNIVAIVDGRMSLDKIQFFIEWHYMSKYYSLEERMHFSSHLKDNPYPAEYIRTSEGVPWTGGMTCGHNPFLYARLVKNVRYYRDDNGEEIVAWDKISIQSISSK